MILLLNLINSTKVVYYESSEHTEEMQRRHNSSSGLSTSIPPPPRSFEECTPLVPDEAVATDASLSIICRDTDTMLSSMSCWPTSSRSIIACQKDPFIMCAGRDELTFLRIHFPNISRLQLLLSQFRLLLDSLLVAFGQADQSLEPLLVPALLFSEIIHLQGFGPDVLMQVHQHILLEARFPIVDPNAVIVPIQAVDQSLNGWFIEMSQVRRRLTRLLTHHERLRADQPEGVNHDLSLDRLYWVDHHRNGSRCQLFKRLLGIDIDRGEPAAEARM